MPYRRNYPATVAEVLSDSIRYNPAALRAVRDLRRAKPWRGTPVERFRKFGACLRALVDAYGLEPVHLVLSARDCYEPATRKIYLNAHNLSVVSLLHEFAHVRGADERQACRWSINLFRRVFPRSFARCEHRGHTLVRRARPAAAPAAE